MLKTDGVSVERDTAIGIGARGSIFEVASYGASYVRELASYLVVAAGVEVYLYEVVAARGGGEQAIVETCLFGIGGVRGDDEAFVQSLVAQQIVA